MEWPDRPLLNVCVAAMVTPQTMPLKAVTAEGAAPGSLNPLALLFLKCMFWPPGRILTPMLLGRYRVTK